MGRQVNQFQQDLAQQIVEYCSKEGLQTGDRLTERKIAMVLGVSRSPIRSALALLAEKSIIEHVPNSGYKLLVGGSELAAVWGDTAPSEYERLYEQILKDRFAEILPKQNSERDLMKRYNVTRGVLLKVLLRLSNEGLLYRSQGHGWVFSEMLVTPEAYEASYEFRLTLEPKALLVPGFKIDEVKLKRCYEKHLNLLEKGMESITSTEQFELDAELHELLMSFSGNPYFLQAIQHQNSLRRAVEYESFYMQERMEESCREHIEIMDALMKDRLDIASTLLARHLQLASEAQQTFEHKAS